MNELMLTFNGIECNFNLYDYRCDKYTQEISAYINDDNLSFIYKIHQSDNGCHAKFFVSCGNNFILRDAIITDIFTYDKFIQINLKIDDISKYTNYRI